MNIKPVYKAVMPVAGLGTRFLPVTKAVPKELLPIFDKPLLHIAIEEALASGIESILLVNRPEKEMIEQYVQTDPTLLSCLNAMGKDSLSKSLSKIDAWPLQMAYQNQPLGLGHAILCAKDWVGEDPFVVLLPDDLIFNNQGQKMATAQLIERYAQTGQSQVALMKVPQKDIHLYGACEGEERLGNKRSLSLTRLVEKPDPSEVKDSFAVVGRYLLTKEIWPLLEEQTNGKNGEIQLTCALDKLCQAIGMEGWLFEGKRIDAGTKVGLLQASILEALTRPEYKDDVKAMLQEFI